jgi:hypothetical protein
VTHFVDDRHTMYVGWVLGIARDNGVDANAVVDADGNYTDRIEVVLSRPPSGVVAGFTVTLTLIVPPPPSDWWPM